MTVNVDPNIGIYISIYTRFYPICQMYIYNQFPDVLPLYCNSYGLPQEQQTAQILDTIANNPADKLLVFDKSDGPFTNELEYIDWIEKTVPGREFIIVTSNYNYHFNKHPKIVHHPYYFFTMLNNQNTVVPEIANARPYKISCLNRNPWLHKSLNFAKMSKQLWFNDVKASFGVWYEHLLPTAITAELLDLITNDEAEYIKSIYPMPLALDGDDLRKFESNDCPTYQQCYVDYAPESRYEYTFISEKTWKPIFSGQFFFVLGPCGIIDYLRNIGVDVFDDLIDHSYDQEPDLETKVELALASITQFLGNDVDRLWLATYHRRKKNLDLMYSPDFQQFMSADLFSRVS